LTLQAWKSGDSVFRVAVSASSSTSMDARNQSGDLFEFSQLAVDLLAQYRVKFPALLQRLGALKGGNVDYQKKDLFAMSDSVTPDLLLTWLRQVGCSV
jgi:hypothetical protein